MSYKAVSSALVLIALGSCIASATEIRINGTTTFYTNYEDDTNVATGDIPTTNTGASFVPNAPQVGAWNSFQGTASPNFENVQVTDFALPGDSGGNKYLRTFRTPNTSPDTPFESNPGTRIGYDGVNQTANIGDTFHFETRVRAQLVTENTNALVTVLGVNDLSTFSGIDMIGIAFRSDGAVLSTVASGNRIDTGLVWTQDTWHVLKVDYTDGADTFTLTFGGNSVELDLIKDSVGGTVVGNKRVGLVTFGNGTGGAASGTNAINGGLGSRLFYDAVPLPGDFNNDGNVDGADFVAWQTNFPKSSGATFGEGDADGDGDVDGADFVVWQTNFPSSSPGAGVSPVPEPGALLLASLGAVALFVFVRKKHH